LGPGGRNYFNKGGLVDFPLKPSKPYPEELGNKKFLKGLQMGVNFKEGVGAAD